MYTMAVAKDTGKCHCHKNGTENFHRWIRWITFDKSTEYIKFFMLCGRLGAHRFTSNIQQWQTQLKVPCFHISYIISDCFSLSVGFWNHKHHIQYRSSSLHSILSVQNVATQGITQPTIGHERTMHIQQVK